jgi:hypothetical protein
MDTRPHASPPHGRQMLSLQHFAVGFKGYDGEGFSRWKKTILNNILKLISKNGS